MTHYDTDLSKQRFPGIAKAALEMSYCNGGVNRDRSERDVLRDLQKLMTDGVDLAFDLAEIDGWLSSLDHDQLEVVVDGEQSEMERVLATAPVGTDKFLNDIFHGVA